MFFLPKSEQNRIFKEALNGFGFEEIQFGPDGLHCEGCQQIIKRPAKMYIGGTGGAEKLCKRCIIELYNPENT